MANLPGNIFTILVVDNIGAKPLLCEEGHAPHRVLICPDLTFMVCVCSGQPAGVQPERVPHLCGAEQKPKSAAVLLVQRRVRHRLERSGCGGHGALPHAATVLLREPPFSLERTFLFEEGISVVSSRRRAGWLIGTERLFEGGVRLSSAEDAPKG